MKFPSQDFDDAITSWCHGTITKEQVEQIEPLLANDPLARDEYLWQVELHARLSSTKEFLIAPAPLIEPAPTRPSIAETRSQRPIRYPSWVIMATLICVMAYLMIGHFLAPPERVIPIEDQKKMVENRTTTSGADRAPSESQGSMASAAGLIRPNVRFAWAQDAPILVGTGQADPLPLGAFVPYNLSGHTLHVWDWSKGKMSRVYKEVRLFEAQRLALSPDGKLLVISDGRIIYLETGQIGRIDLGPEYFSNEGDQIRRIQDLRFSPVGSRLALLATDVDLGPPLPPLLNRDLKFIPEILMLKLPGGQLLSKFPSGHGSVNRYAFSGDGERIYVATPTDGLKQRIIARETHTGKVIHTFEPEVEQHAYALDVAPSGERLAVFDGVGALLIWDTRTRKLLHRIGSVRHESYSTALKFSKDSRYIAVNAVQKSFVVDVEAGKVAATLPQVNAAHFLWSDDGTRLTMGTGFAHYEGGSESLYNLFPAVFEWNWREAKLIRSYESTPPTRKEK